MKNTELNLDALENADNAAIERMSEKYAAIDDRKKEKLFDKSQKLYLERTREIQNNDTTETVVSGVDVYRRPVWRKFLAAAAALLLVAGIGAGGAVLLNNMRNTPDTAMTSTDINAPFGDISNEKIRLMTTAYAPALLEISEDSTKKLADAFNFYPWETIDSETLAPDGEFYTFFVYNSGQPFRLTFYAENTVEYESGENKTKYRVSGEIYRAAVDAAQPVLTGTDDISNHLVMCAIEDLTVEGVWKHTIPMNMFKTPDVPDELNGKNAIEYEPIICYIADFSRLENVAAYSDNIIIGRVDGISYRTVGEREDSAETILDITVSGDITGEVSAGDSINIITMGGFYSRSSTGNTWYHEIVGSGELPIVGKEYAFFVSKGERGYSVTGNDQGMLYRADNTYVRNSDSGYEYFTLDELKEKIKK